jgi:hypothetical protein
MRTERINKLAKQQENTLHSAVICLACYGIFEEVAKEDSCAKCGHRYNPEEKGDKCPECGSDDYICHCPGCDAEDPPYLVEVVDDMDNYFESEHPQQFDVFDNIEKFLVLRAPAR